MDAKCNEAMVKRTNLCRNKINDLLTFLFYFSNFIFFAVLSNTTKEL